MSQNSLASKIALFFGAGVSFPLPTAMPLVDDVLDALWDGLAEKIRDTWEDVTVPAKPDQWPQFELVMEEVRQVHPNLARELLDCYRKVDVNENHRLLARLGMAGCNLVTTNFDANVEAAIEECGGRPRALASVKDCVRQDKIGAAIPLLKLHGCITRPQTIVSTIGALTRRSVIEGPSGLSPPRQRLLSRFLDSRTCFVLGYSGSDRYDVVPALERMSKTYVVLISHCLSRPSPTDAQILKHIHDPIQRVKESHDSDIQLEKGGLPYKQWCKAQIQADTTDFLYRLANMCDLDVSAPPMPLPATRERPYHVAETCRLIKPHDALTVVMRILDDANKREAVRVMLNSAAAHRVPQNVEYQLRINQIRFNYEGLEEVRELDELKRRISRPVDSEIEAQISYFRAYALDSASQYDEALHEVEKAIALSKTSKMRYQELQSRGLKCLLLARLDRLEEALSEFRSLYKPMKAAGMSGNLAEVCNNIAVLYAQGDRLDNAEELMNKALRLWEMTGQLQEHQEVRANLVNLLFHKGENDRARKELAILVRDVRFPSARAHALLLRGHDSCSRLSNWSEGLADLASSVEILLALRSDQHLLAETIEICEECLNEYRTVKSRLPQAERADAEYRRLKKVVRAARG